MEAAGVQRSKARNNGRVRAGQVSRLEDTVSLLQPDTLRIIKQITEDLHSPLMENGGYCNASLSPLAVKTQEDRQTFHLLNQAGVFSCLKLMAGR